MDQFVQGQGFRPRKEAGNEKFYSKELQEHKIVLSFSQSLQEPAVLLSSQQAGRQIAAGLAGCRLLRLKKILNK
jgi:hypothetical protein